MAPPVRGRPSPSSLARLMFSNKAPSVGKSKSKASASSKRSKRKATRAAASHTVAFGASGSSSTPIPEQILIHSDDTNPSANGSGCGGDGSGSGGYGNGSGGDGSGFGDTQTAANQSLDVIDDGTPVKKRSKKCTSDVWQYFTKKEKIVELEGNKFTQLWGYCNFPKCKASYRAKSYSGTSGFWNYLRSAHSIMKGQACLKVEKDHEKGVTVMQPYKYDLEVSLKKVIFGNNYA